MEPTGFRKVHQLIGYVDEDEVYHFPANEDELSLAVGDRGYCVWSKRANETLAVLVNGAIYRGVGSGPLRKVAP